MAEDDVTDPRAGETVTEARDCGDTARTDASSSNANMTRVEATLCAEAGRGRGEAALWLRALCRELRADVARCRGVGIGWVAAAE